MTGAILRGRTLTGDQRLGADVVVVGSGAAGAVVAAELAGAGRRVMVLEEGPHVPPVETERLRPSESLRKVWRDGGMTAAIGLGDSPVINVTMGRCVGGSSVLTGGVCFRTPPAVLQTWAQERGLPDLSERALEPLFEYVEEAIHVETVPVEMRSRSTALWAEGARRLGIEVKPTRRNTHSCVGAGLCNFGCPHGARLGVDRNFLPRAVASGATVLSDCLVDRLIIEGDRAVGVRGRLLDERGRRGARVEVRAPRVVVAAGAGHSPLLLRASGVGRRSGQVGRNLTLHPAFRMLARFDERVDGWRGALQSAWSDAWEHERITMMSVFVPPAVVLAAVPGFGPRFTNAARQLPHLAMFGALIHDEGGGRVLRVPGGREPLMVYRMDRRDRAAIPAVVRHLGEVFLAAGARELYLPILGHEPVDADAFRRLDLERVPARRFECSSQHPLGTCRMGADPATSVVDPRGRAWDVRGLHVVDGSILPTSLGVNPQLTIMTMALRLAHLMLEE